MQNIIITVLGVACLLSLIGSSQSVQLSLRIQPSYVQFDTRTTTEAKVLCVLQDTAGRTVPLAGCQYTVYGQQEIWEFSQGPSSPRGSSGKWVGSYQGRGLQHGECGVTVTGFRDEDRLILGCRVRPANQDVWIYEAVMVYAETFAPMQFHLQPQVTLAAAGSDVTFNGAAEHELSWCRFYLPPNITVRLNFNDGPSSATQQHARYHGAGLEDKQCGVTLLDVKQERSGFVRGRVHSWVASSYRASIDFAQLIVLTAPEAPLLTVNATGLLAPGHVLHATCVVKNSRPVANLTWILGDEVIREDNINEAPLDSKWRWSHDMQTIEQNLEHVVTLSDDGKRLKCRASHVALASGSQDSTSHIVLGFTPPESTLLTDVRVSGNVLQAKCIVSNSRPVANISWFLDDNVVREDNINEAPLDSKWRLSPKLETIEQHLKFNVTSTDNGKELKCRASHVALAYGSQDSRSHVLRFTAPTDPCQPNLCGDNSECRVIGSSTFCSCLEHFVGSPPFCRDEPRCGLRGQAPALITQGQDALVGEFPWHAGLYGLVNGSYVYFCGGTLIKSNFIVTAAHCIYSEKTKQVYNVTDIKVALGKMYRDFNGDSQNKGLQVLDVESIHLPRKYRGSRVDYRYDIAVLKLTSHASLTTVVKLACVEWGDLSEEEELSNGDKGTVAGWGSNNNHTAGPMALQWIDLPWIDQDTCYNATVFQAHKYLKDDKFCAGFVNEAKSVCKGDSGGGYMVLKEGRYYLRGVVSVHLSIAPDPTVCAADRYTSFTTFADYSSWVKKTIGQV